MQEVLYYLIVYGMYFVYALILFILLRIIFRAVVKKHHSNWNHLIDEFNFSSEEFYKRLKEQLQSHGIKKVRIRFVFLKEGGTFSASRMYLRVEWKSYQYDLCAAPFGKGFFISWWLLYNHSIWEVLIAKVPFVGEWLRHKWFPVTYYKVDSASMFMTYCHQSVLKVIDEITDDSGVRAMSEGERKPILSNIFKR